MKSLDESSERAAFEAAVRAKYTTANHRLTARVDFPGSERLGQYVSHHIEFAWQLWKQRAEMATSEFDEKLKECK